MSISDPAFRYKDVKTSISISSQLEIVAPDLESTKSTSFKLRFNGEAERELKICSGNSIVIITTALSEFRFGGALKNDLAIYISNPSIKSLTWETQYTGYFEKDITTEPLPDSAKYEYLKLQIVNYSFDVYVFDNLGDVYSRAKATGVMTSVMIPKNEKYFITVNDSKLMYMPIIVSPKQINYTHGVV